MAKYTSDDIKALARSIKRSKKNKKPFNLLMGAGCSLTAHMPSGQKLLEDIHAKYSDELCDLNDAERKDYGKCMGALSINERKELLTPYLQAAKVNWAHIAIASLIKEGYIAYTLTFNFDSILARACGLMGQYPATYDFAAAATNSTKLLETPCIVHLHGQGSALKMLNSDDETKEHAEKLQPFISDCINSASTLVIGYSGQSDQVFRVIANAVHSERLFWAGYPENPTPEITKLLNKNTNCIKYYGEADADRFLIDLANALDCWPPKLFKDPYGHLLDELEPVQDYPMENGNTTDLLKNLRTQLTEDQTKRKLDLNSFLMKGEWDEIIKLGDPNDNDQKDSIAWAYFMHGNQLISRARPTKDEKLFTQAYEKYQKAIEIKPNMHEAYNNWGNALSDLAKKKKDSGLFTQAFEKYQKAIDLKPDDHEAYYNWGTTLSNLAKQTDDEKLFQQACKKYQKAINIKPDYHQAYNNCGNSLTSLWRLTHEDKHLVEAREKLEKAAQINPDKLYNFACLHALLGEAEECRKALFHCKDKGTLASKDHLTTDKDLDSVRDLPWFAELLEGL
jgi:tetratricopeptide (TPR) repeat protein